MVEHALNELEVVHRSKQDVKLKVFQRELDDRDTSGLNLTDVAEVRVRRDCLNKVCEEVVLSDVLLLEDADHVDVRIREVHTQHEGAENLKHHNALLQLLI